MKSMSHALSVTFSRPRRGTKSMNKFWHFVHLSTFSESCGFHLTCENKFYANEIL